MGKPKSIEKTDRIIGLSEYRDGSIVDYIWSTVDVWVKKEEFI